MNPIIIRCDVTPETGLGHYSRCLTLKDTIESLGRNTLIAVRTSPEFHNTVEADLIIHGSLDDEINQLSKISKHILLDNYHRGNAKTVQFHNYLKQLKTNSFEIALIEGLEDDSLDPELYSYIDALFTPYITKDFAPKIQNHFVGKEFLNSLGLIKWAAPNEAKIKDFL